MLAGLVRWFQKRAPKPLRERLAVTFDSEGAEVKALGDTSPDWNRRFRWHEVEQICVTDGGLFSSNVVRVSVRGQTAPIVVLIEAEGGVAFFGELRNRKLLPEAVWRSAIGDPQGGTHCWP